VAGLSRVWNSVLYCWHIQVSDCSTDKFRHLLMTFPFAQ